MAISIDITDRASPLINAVRDLLRSGELERAAGQSTANLIRARLAEMQATSPNKLGGRRTNFYGKAAKSVNVKPPSNGEVVVNINWQGLRQRWKGGTIVPVARKYLTIPAIPLAYGKRASEFKDLRFAWSKDRKPVGLVNKAGKMYFWLVKKVNQKGDPYVLPNEMQMQDAAMAGVVKKIQQVLDKGGDAKR